MKLPRNPGMLRHLSDSVQQPGFRLGRALASYAEPCQADVICVVKFGRIELAVFKRSQKLIVAQGRSSEVEFHRSLSSTKIWSGKEKGPDPRIGAIKSNVPQFLARLRGKNGHSRENVGAPTLIVQNEQSVRSTAPRTGCPVALCPAQGKQSRGNTLVCLFFVTGGINKRVALSSSLEQLEVWRNSVT
jgi:hypothetical protein